MKHLSAADALRTRVLPALDALTQPDEVSSVGVSVSKNGEVWASLDFAGEGEFSTMIFLPDGDESSHWSLRKFASDLQDHIAESRRGWGTLRPYPADWDL
jgi:hypothetical protein